ncbi:MAG: DUF835 domain-containing protein [Halobacteriota archaeon]|nr:DUF835 domain-containing protein [Halobacteriota archaeon]
METKERILIVDDDKSTCKSLELVFGKKGYETETAGTGQEALNKARNGFFNVALLDIKLPDVSGVDLLAPLKEIHPDMAVIMATAYATMESAVRALNEGASSYITKPLNMDEVLATIREPLEKQHLVEEKKRTEEALRKSEEKLRLLFESASDGIFVLNGEGRYTEVNQKLLKMHGFSSKDEILGEESSTFIASYDIERAVGNIKKTLKKGTVTRLEYTALKADGSEFPVEMSGTALKEASGNPIDFVGIVRDISDRKHMEIEREALIKKLERLIEESPVATISTDLSGNILTINKSAKKLLEIERYENKSISSILGEEIMIEAKDDFSLNYAKKDGIEEIPLSVSTAVLKEGRKKKGMIITLKDLSELQELLITPVSENDSIETEMKYQLDHGFIYIVEEEKPEKGFDVFKDLVKHGIKGLYISRTNPAVIRRRYNLEKTPNIWITINKIPEENCINPDQLEKLHRTISGFVKQADNSIIFFEGLEYLIIQNGFQRVFKFIEFLNDVIMISPTRLIVSLDPVTLDKRELHIIRRDMVTIPEI